MASRNTSRSSLRKHFSSNKHSIKARRPRGYRPFVEKLEDRTLPVVTLTGLPNWLEHGPRPIEQAQLSVPPTNRAGGAVQDIAPSPFAAGVFFLGTVNGGVWRTTNGANTWTAVTDQFASLAIGSVAYSPLDATGNTVFAGTGLFSNGFEGGPPIGLLRTTDGGDNWSLIGPELAGRRIKDILPTSIDLDPGAGVLQVVLAGTINGDGITGSRNYQVQGGALFRSVNNGLNFAPVVIAPVSTGAITGLIADPNNINRFYAAVPGTGGGVFRSDDGGVTWNPFNTGITSIVGSSDIQIAAHDAGATTVLYAGVATGNTVNGVFRSPDDGANWTPLAAVPGGFVAGASFAEKLNIVADPGLDNVVYISGQGDTANILRYNPAGAGSWVNITEGGTLSNTDPHADSRDLVFNPFANSLLEADDGGFYGILNPQNAAANDWANGNGTGDGTALGAVEFYSTAYDNLNNLIFGGTQDNGTNVENSPLNGVWTNFLGGDGQTAQAALSGGNVVRYSMSNNLGGFFRRTFNAANAPVTALTPVLLAAAATPAVPLSGLNASDAAFGGFFFFPYEINATNSNRLLLGSQLAAIGLGAAGLYESANEGDVITNVTPAGLGGVMAVAYGATNNADAAYVADSNGDIWVRTTAVGAFTLTNFDALVGTGTPLDVIMDPNDFNIVYAIDADGVFQSTNGGTTWTDLTNNLADLATVTAGPLNLRSVALVQNTPAAGDGVLLVGGLGGVFRRQPGFGLPGTPTWSEFGLGLPNAIVKDLRYDVADDVLIAGTFGRGAWTVTNALVEVTGPGILEICGDSDWTNQDDTFLIIRNAANPLLLDVFVNGDLEFEGQLDTIQQINVFAAGGNDNLIVDSSNGLITIPGGIRYDGDHGCPNDGGDEPQAPPGIGGFDTLTLRQTGGDQQTSDILNVGATPGQGTSTIVGPSGTQVVHFQYLEPIVDGVPSLTLVINGGLVGSILNASNAIDLQISDLFGATWGEVTIDSFEPIHFTNKVNLTIDAENGNDSFFSNLPNLPTGLVTITVIGGDGNDTLQFVAVPNGGGFTTVTANGDEGNDIIDAGQVTVATNFSMSGGNGNDSLAGGPGNDTLDGGAGDDLFIGSLGTDSVSAGTGVDNFRIDGTDINDRIDVNQTAATTLQFEVGNTANGFDGVLGGAGTATVTLTIGTLERVTVNAKNGDDIMRVTWADALGVDGAVNTVRYFVDGGPAFTRDRLAVVDNGTGDMVIYRKGVSDSDGSITVGPGNAEPLEADFTNVEFVDPVLGADGDLVVFKHDPFEFNNSRLTATHLGAAQTINVDPTIDPGADVPFNLPGDEDFYRVEALTSGTLDFQVFFRQIATVPSGRPGLPGAGDLQLQLFDSDGTLIVSGAPGGFGTNDATDDERIRIPCVQGQIYFLRVFGATGPVVNNYTMTIINEAAAVPFDIELDDDPIDATEHLFGAAIPTNANSDTGRSRFDNITFDNTPTIFFRLDDAFFENDLPGNPSGTDTPPDEVIPILHRNGPAQPVLPGYTVGVFVETGINGPEVLAGFATQVTSGVWTFTFTTALADGSHFISARVQMIDPATPTQTGFGAFSQSLEIIVDTAPPAAPTVDLDDSSDTGVIGDPATNTDNITSDTTPTLFGTAEADSFVRVFALDRNGVRVLIAATTAEPFDGGDQFPNGRWVVTANTNLNDPTFFDRDGLRTIEVEVVDVAGNVSDDGTLDIFIDTQGPQVTNVFITGFGPTDAAPFNLFTQKTATALQGPTPLVNSITISFRDLPPRVAAFLYNALQQGPAQTPGTYVLKGDSTGIIAILQIIVTNDAPVAGAEATATVQLVFAAPLPDDRYTLTVNDNIVDPAGNALDGESNAAEPNLGAGFPTFPSGDGQPGGDFIARFTVDSRPEIATYFCGAIYIDLNGNLIFDAVGVNNDQTNADKVFLFGVSSDAVFAGKFTNVGQLANLNGNGIGFDRLGAYGRFNGLFRFLLDINDDGVSDLTITPTLQINGLPVAGNFDGDLTNGDEIGVFDGKTWFLDTNHDNNLTLADAIITNGLTGLPIVGDFDGNGQFDLATYKPDQNIFFFDLNPLGAPHVIIPLSTAGTFSYGFPGSTEKPVAADMDQDGVTDIGLFVTDRAGSTPSDTAEWYFLLSGFRAPVAGTVTTLNHAFDPSPFGTDLFAKFGDKKACPLVGNFDPPASSSTSSSVVQKASLVSTTAQSSKKTLTVVGTSGNDTIWVSPTADQQSVRVTMSGIDMGTFKLSDISRIAAYGRLGDDFISVDPTITLDALLVGGAGNDELRGGGGNDILLGNGGNDKLFGKNGRNLLIGGIGADLVVGGAYEDLLIGSSTTFDTNEAALFSVMSEWTSARDFSTRLLNLQGVGSGTNFTSRANGTNYLKGSGAGKTVFDDAVKDTLQGNGGRNWYIARFDPVGSPLNDAIIGLVLTDGKSKIL